MALKRLNGDELVKHKADLEGRGFVDTVRDVMRKLINNKEDEVTYHEVRYILERVGE